MLKVTRPSWPCADYEYYGTLRIVTNLGESGQQKGETFTSWYSRREIANAELTGQIGRSIIHPSIVYDCADERAGQPSSEYDEAPKLQRVVLHRSNLAGGVIYLLRKDL